MEDCKKQLQEPLKKAFFDECSYQYSEEFGGCILEVPFMRPNMDYIRLWVKTTSGTDERQEYVISDAGKTYSMLFAANLSLESTTQENTIKAVKRRYGLEKAKYEIRLTADETNLGNRLLDGIQAVASLSHLTSHRRERSLFNFRESVVRYVSENGLMVDENKIVEGRSRNWTVDLEAKNGHKSYVGTIHGDNKYQADRQATKTAFMWVELNELVREIDFISVVDDLDGEIGEDSLNMLRDRSDSVVRWSEKEQLIQKLKV